MTRITELGRDDPRAPVQAAHDALWSLQAPSLNGKLERTKLNLVTASMLGVEGTPCISGNLLDQVQFGWFSMCYAGPQGPDCLYEKDTTLYFGDL